MTQKELAIQRAKVECEFASGWCDRAAARLKRLEAADVGAFSIDEHEDAEHGLAQAERALALADLALKEASLEEAKLEP